MRKNVLKETEDSLKKAVLFLKNEKLVAIKTETVYGLACESSSKTAIQKAEATIRMKEATGEIDWDLAAMRASQSSWKDEWLTLLFSIPLVLSFMGEWGRGIVADGFTALAGMPQWYQIALGAIVSASFATRSASKLFNMRKK